MDRIIDGINRRSIILGILGFLSLISLPSFLDHFLYFIGGQVEKIAFQNRWDLVLLNIAGFLLFIIPLQFRRKADWKSFSIYSAFIISLFVEMYGIPLTVYLSSASMLSVAPPQTSWHAVRLLGESFMLTPWMITGLVVTLLGMAIVALGWITIYRSEGELVDSGIYSYSRHPQYVGIILIALGWFIGWPTLLTTLLLPLLIYTYYDLSRKEEQEVSKEVGEESYREYKNRTKMFL